MKKMYYLSSLNNQEKLEVVLSDLEHALVILDEVSDKFRSTPSELARIEGDLLRLIESIDCEIQDNEFQGLGNVA